MAAEPRKSTPAKAAAKTAPAKAAAAPVDAPAPEPTPEPVAEPTADVAEPTPESEPVAQPAAAAKPDKKPEPEKEPEAEAKTMTEAGAEYAALVRDFIATGREGVIKLREAAVDVGQISPVAGEHNVYPAVRRLHGSTEHVTRGLDRLAGALADLERAAQP